MRQPLDRSFAGGAAALAVLITLHPAVGQQDLLRPFTPDDGRPVMRAQPVRPPRTLPAEPLDEEPAAATPLPRGTPARKPLPPRATPPPPPRAIAVPKAVAAPKATPVPMPQPADPGGEIRLSPQGTARPPDQVQLEIADTYFFRKQYEMAATEYQRYLDQYVASNDRATALYRMGESYRQTGSLNAARGAYEQLLANYQTGDFIGAAAYRVAGMAYQAKDFANALVYYRKASVRLKEPGVIIAARFYTASCLEALGQRLEARLAYEELAAIRENNPFLDASRLSYSLLLKDAGMIAKAVTMVQTIAKETENAELKAECTVRAGLWMLEQEPPATAKATEELKRALDMPGIGRWRELAQLGLTRVNFESGKYQEVIDQIGPDAAGATAETKPELLLLQANSYRQLGKFPEAQALYDRVAKEFGATPWGKQAAYERLVNLYSSDDPGLVAEIDSYLAKEPDAPKHDQLLLMKAETLYKKKDYAAAMPLYDALTKSRQLTGNFKAEALFKMGFCAMELRESARAITAFTELIDGFPTYKLLPYALVQRGVALQTQKDLPGAEKDYDLLLRKFPKVKEREFALQQKALIRGQMNDNEGMGATFEQLLREFPQSPAGPQAHYWVGWAAYEGKNFKKAVEQLVRARDGDREEFFERASLRIMLSHFSLEDVEATAREADLYAKEGKTKVPIDVLRWLGSTFATRDMAASAEPYLAEVAAREDTLPGDFLVLGESRLKQGKFAPAAEAFNGYLERAREPGPRADGLLLLAQAQIGEGSLDGAQKSVDDALTLQPEGKINGAGRERAGDIQMAKGRYEEAAKLYRSVAVIIDDEELTPRSLSKAHEAYLKAGMEPEAKKTLNTLQSRYPEWYQKKRLASPAAR